MKYTSHSRHIVHIKVIFCVEVYAHCKPRAFVLMAVFAWPLVLANVCLSEAMLKGADRQCTRRSTKKSGVEWDGE